MTWPAPDTFQACTVELSGPEAAGLDSFLRPPGADPSAGGRPSGSIRPDFVYDRPGLCVLASGAAAVLDLPGPWPRRAGSVASWLVHIPIRGEPTGPGAGPLALGALPFSPDEAGRLTVPGLVLRRAGDGGAWLATAVAPAGDPDPDPRGVLHRLRHGPVSGAPSGPAPGVLEQGRAWEVVRSQPDEDGFVSLVERALEAIATGTVSKVVLARHVEACSRRSVDAPGVLGRLRHLERTATVFAIPVPPGRGRPGALFLGASPELLVARRGLDVVAHPLAGTTPVGDDPLGPSAAGARLARSAKDLEEHGHVVSAVAEGLRPWCEQLAIPEPAPVTLRTMVHLGTRITGRLRTGPELPAPDALSLAAALHPTPAVAGSPTDAALELITRLEPAGRGQFAGPVGWVDATGDGEFVVGIRSATVAERWASVYAGVGIVEGSDAKEELAETTVKLHTALEGLGLTPSR